MSDVDVAAIRARCTDLRNLRAIASRTAYTGDDLTEAKATELANSLADELARTDVPALLAALATRDARIAELTAERDNARTALQITLDSARIDRAAAVSTDRLALLRAAITKLRSIPVGCTALTGPVWYGEGWAAAIRELEEIADRWPDPEPEAHPPVDEYRVEFHEPADADLPCRGWGFLGAYEPTEERAVEAMRRRRQMRPGRSPMRVVRTRKTFTVVATEPAPPPDGPGPHATENGPVCPPDATEPPPETGATEEAP